MLIAADIGATKAWFVCVDEHNKQEKIYASQNFATIEELLQCYLADCGIKVTSNDNLVLAVPGPVHRQTAQLTNLPWLVNGEKICRQFGFKRVKIINDFGAATLAAPTSDQLIQLHQGELIARKTYVVTGAGSGLGLAYACWDGTKYQIRSTEGGHLLFAPQGLAQEQLLHFMQKKQQPVLYEHLLSGSGLANIYQFVSGQKKFAADINKAANNGEQAAQQSIKHFVAIMAAFAGNLALLFKPSSGIYIAGGVTIKLASWLEQENFTQHYLDRGKLSNIARATSVFLINDESIGLKGAILSMTTQP